MKISVVFPAVTLCLLSQANGCSASLASCPERTKRGWCLMDISAQDETPDHMDLMPPVLSTQAWTACVKERPGPSMLGMSVIALIDVASKYRNLVFPLRLGLPGDPIRNCGIICDALVCVDFAQDGAGHTLCQVNGSSTNPYPQAARVIDIQAAINNLKGKTNHSPPGPRPETSGLGGGATQDCSACVYDSCTDTGDPNDLAACVMQHCAGLCSEGFPQDSEDTDQNCQDFGSGIGGSSGATPPCVQNGGSCGVGAGCCPGLVCYGTDVGSQCM